MRHQDLDLGDVNLLKIGRHFRLSPGLKLIVGRNESENNRLEALRKEGEPFFQPQELAGPSAILRGEIADNSLLETASRIVAKYCDGATSETKIRYLKNPLQEYIFIVSPIEDERLAELAGGLIMNEIYG